MKSIFNKIKSKTGETLVETLCAMLLISLTFVMLAGAIVTAARLNKQAQDLEVNFNTEGNTTSYSKNIIINHNGLSSETTVTAYVTNDSNKYIYYEK